MTTLIFALGVLCGCVATFVFMFINISISNSEKKKNDKPILSDELIEKLYDRYLESMKNDGGKS